MHNGHMSRLARMIAKDSQFTEKIAVLHIDEAHFIYSAGLPHYGLPAFRSAWARLGELRIKLRKGLPVQALSGTQPPHIKKVIKSSLLMNDAKMCSIKLSSNRPNIAYATHAIAGGKLTDFRNLDFLVPFPFPEGYIFPKTLVFHDSRDIATNAAQYTLLRLPEHLREHGIIKHYHSMMSKEYLTETFDDFSNPNGKCRVLHATEGASTVRSTTAYVHLANYLGSHYRDSMSLTLMLSSSMESHARFLPPCSVVAVVAEPLTERPYF